MGITIINSNVKISAIIEYLSEIKDYGISYNADFENFFTDDNRMYVQKGTKQIVIPSFSVRSINDFLWLDDYPELNVFPKRKNILQNDEIILGLPYSDMVNLCFGLQILRNYESLGDYITNRGLQVIYSFRNDSWLYDDEQIFNVIGVVAFSKPNRHLRSVDLPEPLLPYKNFPELKSYHI